MSYFKWIDKNELPTNIHGKMILLCMNKLWAIHKTFGNILGINPKVKAGLEFIYDVHHKEYPESNIHFLLAGAWVLFMEIRDILPDDNKPYIDIWLKERFNIRAKLIGESSIKKYIEDITGLKISSFGDTSFLSEHVNYQ